MLERYFKLKIEHAHFAGAGSKLKARALLSRETMIQSMNCFDPRGALMAIWELVSDANRYVEETKPWQLAKEEKSEELGRVLYDLLESVRFVGRMLAPFLPATSEKIYRLFELQESPSANMSGAWGVLKQGMTLQKGEPLFPKIEVEKL